MHWVVIDDYSDKNKTRVCDPNFKVKGKNYYSCCEELKGWADPIEIKPKYLSGIK